MSDRDFVSLSVHTIDVAYVLGLAADPGCGALSSFCGVTRDSFEGKRVLRLSYEAYEDMAEMELKALCDKVSTRSR